MVLANPYSDDFKELLRILDIGPNATEFSLTYKANDILRLDVKYVVLDETVPRLVEVVEKFALTELPDKNGLQKQPMLSDLDGM